MKILRFSCPSYSCGVEAGYRFGRFFPSSHAAAGGILSGAANEHLLNSQEVDCVAALS